MYFFFFFCNGTDVTNTCAIHNHITNPRKEVCLHTVISVMMPPVFPYMPYDGPRKTVQGVDSIHLQITMIVLVQEVVVFLANGVSFQV